jgi:hypothetical protein
MAFGLDTNVLVRYLLNDDKNQAAIARQRIQQAVADGEGSAQAVPPPPATHRQPARLCKAPVIHPYNDRTPILQVGHMQQRAERSRIVAVKYWI